MPVFGGVGVYRIDGVASEIGAIPVESVVSAITGNSSQTEPAETGSAIGTVGSTGINGSSSQTEPAETGTASGTVFVSGDSSQTEPAETGTAAGTVLVSGSSSQTEPDETGSAAGVVLVSGTSSQTEPAETGTAAGTVGFTGVTGDSTRTDPSETGSADGSVTGVVFSGGFVMLDVVKAVMARITGDTTLSASVGGRIYDIRPQESYLPCVTLDRLSAVDFGHKTGQGQEVRLDLACWSAYEGRLEVLTMGKRVYDLFHELPLTVANATAFVVRCEASDVIEGGDAVTRHIRITLKVTAIGTP